MSPLPFSLDHILFPRSPKTHHSSGSSYHGSSGTGTPHHLSTGAIIGIVVGVFALCFLSIFFYQVYRAKKRGETPIRWGKIILRSLTCAVCGALVTLLCIFTEEAASDELEKVEEMTGMGGDNNTSTGTALQSTQQNTTTTTTYHNHSSGSGLFAFFSFFNGNRTDSGTNTNGGSGGRRTNIFGRLAGMFGKTQSQQPLYDSSQSYGPGKTGVTVQTQPISSETMLYPLQDQEPYQQGYPQHAYPQSQAPYGYPPEKPTNMIDPKFTGQMGPGMPNTSHGLAEFYGDSGTKPNAESENSGPFDDDMESPTDSKPGNQGKKQKPPKKNDAHNQQGQHPSEADEPAAYQTQSHSLEGFVELPAGDVATHSQKVEPRTGHLVTSQYSSTSEEQFLPPPGPPPGFQG